MQLTKLGAYLGLYSWLEPSKIEFTDFGIANTVIQQQNMIGWRSFISGCISIEWGNCVHHHITQQNYQNLHKSSGDCNY